jgi:NAD(P)H-flavin reductase
MDRVETSGSLGLVKVDVSLNTPTRIKPGKYFNVFFPGNRQHGYPAVVYWPSSSESASRPVDNISFLMSSRARWPIEQLQEKKKLILDGPYGQDLNLQLYENVFLAAQGIGIAGVLPWALELAKRKHHDNKIRDRIQFLAEAQEKLLKEEKTAVGDRLEDIRGKRAEFRLERENLRSKRLFLDATRKLVLFWTLEDNLQMDMVKRELEMLQKLDPKEVSPSFLRVWIAHTN